MPFEKDPDELGALWVKNGQRGEYMTGVINGVNVVCFRTTKGGEKAPTWRVMKSKPAAERAQNAPSPVDRDDISW